MIRVRTAIPLVLPFLGIVMFSSCGGGDPAGPTPPTTQPPAGPTPTPSPTPSGPVVPSSCSGPPPTGSLGNCGVRRDPQLHSELRSVIDGVKAQRDIFYADGVTIRYLDRYRKAVVEGLDARGLCGVWDYGDGASGLGDTIYVRTADNRLSEAYDVISGSGQARIGYQNSCEPASAQPALEPRYPNRDQSCSLPPSGTTFCVGSGFESEYGADVRAAIVALTTERPELFDLQDALPSELSYGLRDPHAYIAGVIEKLRQKGYCAREEEELAVKRDNSVSENFDIVRTPAGRPNQYSLFAYKGKCHNALF